MLHVSIAPDILFYFLSFPISNTLLTSLIFLVLSIVVGILFLVKQNNSKSTFVFFVRYCLNQLYNLFQPILQNKIDIFFPFLSALFLFILFSNWLGLLPGVGSIVVNVEERTVPLLKAATADLNTTISLALIVFIVIQVSGIKYLGLRGYLSKFISFSGIIAFFTGILETISEFSKIISFAFRLFGNIFAGEVLLAVIVFLVPILAPFPFLLLEVFVGFIQALVFAMLAAVFINLATTAHN